MKIHVLCIYVSFFDKKRVNNIITIIIIKIDINNFYNFILYSYFNLKK